MAAQASDFDRLFTLMLMREEEEEFKAEIKKNPSLVTIENEWHMTLLHIAARNGNRKICEILIENGADPSFPGGVRRNQTALHYAAEHSYSCAISLVHITQRLKQKDLTPLLGQILEQTSPQDYLIFLQAQIKANAQRAIAATRSSMLDSSSPIFSRSSEETDSDDELLAAVEHFVF